VLARLPRIPNARVLDLGSGQGNTTRCLAEALQPDECIGLEHDAALVDFARTHGGSGPCRPRDAEGRPPRRLRSGLRRRLLDRVEEPPAMRGARDHPSRLAAAVPEPAAGATLVHTFREAGATRLQAGAWTMLEHDATKLRRIYRLSAEATGPMAAQKGILTEAEVGEMIADLVRLEDDPSSVVVMFPATWVIATR
jgi:hypothetical protein